MELPLCVFWGLEKQKTSRPTGSEPACLSPPAAFPFPAYMIAGSGFRPPSPLGLVPGLPGFPTPPPSHGLGPRIAPPHTTDENCRFWGGAFLVVSLLMFMCDNCCFGKSWGEGLAEVGNAGPGRRGGFLVVLLLMFTCESCCFQLKYEAARRP